MGTLSSRCSISGVTSSPQNHHTPLLLLRDGYESTVLTAFFYLLLAYLSPDSDEQRAIFLKAGLSRQADREAKRLGTAERKWMFPLSFIKWKPEVNSTSPLKQMTLLNLVDKDGLYFLQLMKWGVLQYCVVRPLYAFLPGHFQLTLIFVCLQNHSGSSHLGLCWALLRRFMGAPMGPPLRMFPSTTRVPSISLILSLLDHRCSIDLGLSCHVLFSSAVHASLNVSLTSQAFAQVICYQSCWYAPDFLLPSYRRTYFAWL